MLRRYVRNAACQQSAPSVALAHAKRQMLLKHFYHCRRMRNETINSVATKGDVGAMIFMRRAIFMFLTPLLFWGRYSIAVRNNKWWNKYYAAYRNEQRFYRLRMPAFDRNELRARWGKNVPYGLCLLGAFSAAFRYAGSHGFGICQSCLRRQWLYDMLGYYELSYSNELYARWNSQFWLAKDISNASLLISKQPKSS